MKEKDEDLDKLFKKGLEDPVNEPAFRDADWGAMEQMLDKGKKRPAIIYWLPIIGSAAALALLFLGYLFFKPDAVKPGKKEQMAVNQKNITKPAEQEKSNTGTSGEPARQAADSSKQQTKASATYAVSSHSSERGNKSNSFFTLSSGRDRRGTTGQGSNNNNKNAYESTATKNSQPNIVNDQPVIANNVTPANTKPGITPDSTGAAITTKSNDNILASNDAQASVGNKIQPGSNTDTAKQNEKPGKALVSVLTEKPRVTSRQKPNSRPQFAFGVLGSSDLNGVNSSFQQSKIGGNIGMQFSVGFSKWTISTGATYDIKPYLTNFNNYHTTYPFKEDPISVNANCRMLDIPLDVSYQVYSQHANKISLGTGLSSYFMLREDYQFNYSEYATGPPHFTVINKNHNILSVLNLNATYIHQLNSKVGVVVQPYLKVPLSDVGASQVRLQTTGVAVGFNWNLNTYSKPK